MRVAAAESPIKRAKIGSPTLEIRLIGEGILEYSVSGCCKKEGCVELQRSPRSRRTFYFSKVGPNAGLGDHMTYTLLSPSTAFDSVKLFGAKNSVS